MSVPVSLAEIMDEEFARKIEQEERISQVPDVEIESYAIQEDNFEEQLKLALEISAEEAQQNHERTEDTSQLDDDYLYAIQLQQELDAQQIAQSIWEKERKEREGFSKVSCVYDHGNDIFYRGHHYKLLYQDENNIDEEESDGEDSDYISEEEENKIIGIKPHHLVNKPGGREIITKHDSLVCGFKNAENTEQMANSGDMQDVPISNPVYNSLKEDSRRMESQQVRIRGNRLDKSTHEQVLDKRTRVTLLELINGGILDGLDGIISTGKESNVYSAHSHENDQDLAVKIFKTTLNEFKNRSDYIEGEFRFRYQKNQHNPRKFIKIWAEKELRNLKRLQAKEIPCPTPIRVRENVLVMTLIGKNGVPAPRLKDSVSNSSTSQIKNYYNQVIRIMRKMFHQCRLVHADLSEYNILIQKKQVFIIDVSQAVEYDHPRAMEFLRKDCEVISNFFSRKGVDNCLSPRDLFEFVSNVNIQDEEEYLINIEKNKKTESAEESMKDAIFLSKNTSIPRTLHQVRSPDKEIFEGSDSFHDAVTGFRPVNE